jgi:hypothetical protein
VKKLEEECRLGYQVLADLAKKDSEFDRLEAFCAEKDAKVAEQAAEIERLVALAKNDAEVIGYLGPQLTHEHLAREKAEQELQGHKDMIGAMEESARIRCLVCTALRAKRGGEDEDK